MAVSINQNIVTIKQGETGLPPYLDFNLLREKGLEHIGAYSGQIWTDHNTHDPGVTLLEALIYAIMDLGYRTDLPIEDILATEEGTEADNFFTPAQILGCNPVTITDYRKLLLEVEGVKNAWMEPVINSNIYTNKKDRKLYKGTKKKNYKITCAL